jgi:hypothetical protein
MALTFPLPVTAFMNILPVQRITFDTPEQIESSQTAAGEIMTADLAPMLWSGDITLGPMPPAESENVEAMLDILRVAGRSFYAYDTRRPAPRLDPFGTELSGYVPTIYSLPAGNRELQLQALPAGYTLSVGDYLAFDYGSPSRRALHRVVTGAVVGGSGQTPAFEVSPMIRPGATVGTTVALIKAACKAVIVPGSISKGSTFKSITSDMSFRFIQTLR